MEVFTLVVQDDKKLQERPDERLSFFFTGRRVKIVEGDFKACQSIHERNRQHWNLHNGRTQKEGISSLEESLQGVLGDVSKLGCWQYCIGKVFVTIWSDISMQRMENSQHREGRGPVDWHPQCPREDWDFVACSAEEHQSPAV